MKNIHKRLRVVKNYIRAAGIRAIMLAARLFPLDRNKVILESYYGGGFGDNSKPVALSLREKRPSLDLVWAAKPENQDTLPSGIRYVKYHSVRHFWDLATAAVWIDNVRKQHTGLVKRRGQYYIQCWHGGYSFKKIEQDVEDHLSRGYLKNAKWDAKATDLMLSGNEFFSGLCRTVFWYDGEVMKCGSPRLDVLFNITEDQIRAVRSRLDIPEGRKIVLYAPTFRVDKSMASYALDFHRVLRQLEQDMGGCWLFLVRLHPNIADKADAIPYSDDVRSATHYPDLYELIPAVDVVITDYSSIMFEAGLIRKPTFLFATDLADYMGDRGLYFDIRNMPFPLAESNEALLENLHRFDPAAYEEALKKLYADTGACENGTAAAAVADRVLAVLDRKYPVSGR